MKGIGRWLLAAGVVVLGLAAVLSAACGCGGGEQKSKATATEAAPQAPQGTATAAPSKSSETASYRMELAAGSLEKMLMPGEAQGATEGEVMVQMPGMPMPRVATKDQGYPVNHHLEVQIFDKASGAVVNDKVPTITITDQATGTSRGLEDMMAMHGVDENESDLHFGNNAYLPAGMYTVKVTLGDETAVFKDLAVR